MTYISIEQYKESLNSIIKLIDDTSEQKGSLTQDMLNIRLYVKALQNVPIGKEIEDMPAIPLGPISRNPSDDRQLNPDPLYPIITCDGSGAEHVALYAGTVT